MPNSTSSPTAKLLHKSSLSRGKAAGLVLGAVAVGLAGFYYFSSRAATTTFRFTAFADTKTGTSILSSVSKQVMAKNPVFGLYPGDVCDSGPSASCFATWKAAMNGNSNNGLFDRMFVARGNHDSAGATFWAANFDFAAMATRIGATNFTGDDFTYSFDYGNSHFIMVDAPGGGSTTIASSTVTWVDNDLKAAEARGVTHSFASWHGPVHPVGGHCCTDDPRFIKVFGAHPTFRAVFSGHEHNLASVLMDSKWGNTGHPFYQIVTGGAGSGLYACQSGRANFCKSTYGYMMADVNGNTVTLSLYADGGASPINTVSLTGSGTGGTPTPTVQPSGTPTPTPTGSPSTRKGDINADNKVNVFDLSALLSAWGTSNAKADLNGDGTVNVFDLSVLLANWTG